MYSFRDPNIHFTFFLNVICGLIKKLLLTLKSSNPLISIRAKQTNTNNAFGFSRH